MARIEEAIHIECPVEKAFAYTTDAKNWPRWQSIIVEAEQASQGPVCVGTTFKGITRMMGLSMKWSAKVTEYEPNSRWGKSIDSGSITLDEHMTYQPRDRGIGFTIVYDIKVGGLFRLFSPMIVSTMRKETRKSLATLKGIVEAQT